MNRPSPRTAVRHGALVHGDRTAVISSRGTLTYADLARHTATAAEALRNAGVVAGMQVAIAMPNTGHALIAYFGILEAGGIAVPLSPTLSGAEVSALVQAARLSFLMLPESSPWIPELTIGGHASHRRIGEFVLCRTPEMPSRLDTIPFTPGGWVKRDFSSGSTGRPKHMLKTESNIAHDTGHFCKTIAVTPQDLFLAVAPFAHSYGAISFQAAFDAGSGVLVLPRFLPGPVIDMSRRHRPTLFLATPPMIEALGTCHLTPGDADAFRSLRYCICSTGRLTKTVADVFLRRFGVPVRVQYGSTETLSATVDLEDSFEEGRVGHPYPGVEVGIFDVSDRALPPGTSGRIGIRSPAACDRYVDAPDSTALTFRNGYVFPGDAGHMDSRGHLHVAGRSDVINIGGYKVDPLEVERVIRDALPVTDVIVCEGTRSGHPIIQAAVEADPGTVTRTMIVDACRKRLSPHKIPARTVVMRSFPRDANGKAPATSIFS